MYIDQVKDEPKRMQSGDDCIKEPYYFETARNFLKELLLLNHDEQVHCFKFLQKQLADTRCEQNMSMQKEHSQLSELIALHNEGTDKIASGL